MTGHLARVLEPIVVADAPSKTTWTIPEGDVVRILNPLTDDLSAVLTGYTVEWYHQPLPGFGRTVYKLIVPHLMPEYFGPYPEGCAE